MIKGKLYYKKTWDGKEPLLFLGETKSKRTGEPVLEFLMGEKTTSFSLRDFSEKDFERVEDRKD